MAARSALLQFCSKKLYCGDRQGILQALVNSACHLLVRDHGALRGSRRTGIQRVKKPDCASVALQRHSNHSVRLTYVKVAFLQVGIVLSHLLSLVPTESETSIEYSFRCR
jgi:hypothetical protein